MLKQVLTVMSPILTFSLNEEGYAGWGKGYAWEKQRSDIQFWLGVPRKDIIDEILV
jgi:hypothetical protein